MSSRLSEYQYDAVNRSPFEYCRVKFTCSALYVEFAISLHEAGWDDEAIYFAITVCAMFNFYNRWIDASGVHEMSEEAHRAGGKRSAKSGYVR